MVELAVVEGSILEDENSTTMGFSVTEIAHIVTAVLLIHPAETVRLHSLLSGASVTSSSYPS